MSYHRRTVIELAETDVLIEVDETDGKVVMLLGIDDGDDPLQVNLGPDYQGNHISLRRMISALQEIDSIVSLQPSVQGRFSAAQPRAYVPSGPGNGAPRGLADGTD